MKKKVLWIVGGVGWAYDIQFKAVLERSLEYEHVAVFRHTSNMLDEIKEHNPDIIMVMTPSFVSCLSSYVGKVIGYLPSFSAIGILEQYE